MDYLDQSGPCGTQSEGSMRRWLGTLPVKIVMWTLNFSISLMSNAGLEQPAIMIAAMSNQDHYRNTFVGVH